MFATMSLDSGGIHSQDSDSDDFQSQDSPDFIRKFKQAQAVALRAVYDDHKPPSLHELEAAAADGQHHVFTFSEPIHRKANVDSVRVLRQLITERGWTGVCRFSFASIDFFL